MGALNLSAYINDDEKFGPWLDSKRLARDTRTAIQFLDDVLTMEEAPLPEIADAIVDKRRIGLGVMGLGDMLIKLGAEYDSEHGRNLVNNVIECIVEAAMDESEERAKLLGVPEGVKRAALERRNIALFTVAPTGTTSMLAGTSSGVEPVFSAVTYRRVGTEYREIVHPLLREILSGLEPTWAYATDEGTWDWERLKQDISANHGSIRPLVESGALPETPRLLAFRTAHDISPESHVLMQSTVQRVFDKHPSFIRTYAGNSISKTINMPKEATVEDVRDAYRRAFDTGAKGCTVYRDGSRQLQVLSTSKQEEDEGDEDVGQVKKALYEEQVDEYVGPPRSEEEADEQIQEAIRRNKPALDALARLDEELGEEHDVSLWFDDDYNTIVERPSRVQGFTDKLQVGPNKVYVTVNSNGEMPVEVFINQSRPTPNERVAADVIGRLISVALKYGAPLEDITKHLEGHQDESGGIVPGRGYMGSVWGAVASSLRRVEPTVTVDASEEPIREHVETHVQTPGEHLLHIFERELSASTENPCPDCGTPLRFEEGCHKCPACGYSKCG